MKNTSDRAPRRCNGANISSKALVFLITQVEAFGVSVWDFFSPVDLSYGYD
jgi:hypothetical protein